MTSQSAIDHTGRRVIQASGFLVSTSHWTRLQELLVLLHPVWLHLYRGQHCLVIPCVVDLVVTQCYKRLLWVHIFNVHEHAEGKSYISFYRRNNKKDGNSVSFCCCNTGSISHDKTSLKLAARKVGSLGWNWNHITYYMVNYRHFSTMEVWKRATDNT